MFSVTLLCYFHITLYDLNNNMSALVQFIFYILISLLLNEDALENGKSASCCITVLRVKQINLL